LRLLEPTGRYFSMKRYSKLTLALMIVAAFGPYIIPYLGIRLEHIVIYTFLIITLIYYTKAYRISTYFLPFVFIWLTIILWTGTVTFFIDSGYRNYYAVIAGFENYFQPLAIIFIMAFLLCALGKQDIKGHIVGVSYLAIILLALNSVWNLTGMIVDLMPVNIYFWAGRGADISTVAQRASILGRYTGIFNQPIEAGLMYSLGLLLWAYIVSSKDKIRARDALLLILLIINGLLSVSKVFLFGGLPLFIAYIIHESIHKNSFIKHLKSLIIIVPTVYLLNILLSNYWRGYDYLMRFFIESNGDNLATGLLGTRYSSETTVMRNFEQTWAESPFYGFGFGAHGPFDNGYLEFFMQGGVLALLLSCLLFVVLLYYAVQYRSKESRLEAKTLIWLQLLVIGASLGGSTITANRFSVLFWVLVCLFVKYLIDKKKQFLHDNNEFQEAS